MKEKLYTGTVYIGVVGGEMDYGICRDSIERILRTSGDSAPRYTRATKGYEARQMQLDNFIEGPHDFMLLLDHDMVFDPDTLQKLRSHKKPYITGAYTRRQWQPLAPVWFDHNPRGLWPNKPAMKIPSQPIKVGASGWGCMLIHREVILEVRKLLKGEKDIIEDDMDIYPYDLDTVMECINGLNDLVDEKPTMRILRPALEKYAQRLADEIRPLRGSHDVVGSDIRYPFFAKLAGYDLWLDVDVRPGHVLNYPVRVDDYLGQPPEYLADLTKSNNKRVRLGRRDWKKRISDLKG
jgi:hypothetical protein